MRSTVDIEVEGVGLPPPKYPKFEFPVAVNLYLAELKGLLIKGTDKSLEYCILFTVLIGPGSPQAKYPKFSFPVAEFL